MGDADPSSSAAALGMSTTSDLFALWKKPVWRISCFQRSLPSQLLFRAPRLPHGPRELRSAPANEPQLIARRSVAVAHCATAGWLLPAALVDA